MRVPALIVLLLPALFACETVVDVPPPPHDAALVAHGFFSPDSGWAVRVTRKVPYLDAAAPAFVEDAAVEIWAGDRLVATPARVDTGTYAVAGRGPVRGEVYTLRVTTPDGLATEGRDALPPPPPVTAFRDTLVAPDDSTSRRQVTRVEMTFSDPLGEKNHYGLVVVQARWREDRATGTLKLLPPTLFTFASEDPALEGSGLDFLNTEQTLYREAFFTDALFDGQDYTLSFDVQYDAPRPEATVVIRRVLVVLVLSASEAFYRHWTTATEQAFTNENPFAEPLRVYSNLSGGYGAFVGFQYKLLPLGLNDLQFRTLQDLCAQIQNRLPLCLEPRR